LYHIQSAKPENTGVYSSSLAKPAERIQLAVPSTAVYAPGGDGKNYLLWLRGGVLVAQELDVNAIKLLGEARPVADPVSGAGFNGQINVAVSANGLLLYSTNNTLSQLTWLDRAAENRRRAGPNMPCSVSRRTDAGWPSLCSGKAAPISG
jgi:hypothetical protein